MHSRGFRKQVMLFWKYRHRPGALWRAPRCRGPAEPGCSCCPRKTQAEHWGCHCYPHSHQHPNASCQLYPGGPQGSLPVVLASETPGRAFPASPRLRPAQRWPPSYLAGLGHASKLLIFPLLNEGFSFFGPLHSPAHSQHGFQGLSGWPAINFLFLEENSSRRALQRTPRHSDWPVSLWKLDPTMGGVLTGASVLSPGQPPLRRVPPETPSF